MLKLVLNLRWDGVKATVGPARVVCRDAHGQVAVEPHHSIRVHGVCGHAGHLVFGRLRALTIIKYKINSVSALPLKSWCIYCLCSDGRFCT